MDVLVATSAAADGASPSAAAADAVSVGAASTDELPARLAAFSAATALRTSSRISRTLWLRAVDA